MKTATAKKNVRNQKLTDAQVRDIRAAKKRGWNLQEIADDYYVCVSHVSRIVRGITRPGV